MSQQKKMPWKLWALTLANEARERDKTFTQEDKKKGCVKWGNPLDRWGFDHWHRMWRDGYTVQEAMAETIADSMP
jgi:hypothetical protein